MPPPKPKIPELLEANKHDNGKVDVTTDEGRQRQVGARKPPPRDCATGSGVDCGRKISAIGGHHAWLDLYMLVGLTKARFYSDSMREAVRDYVAYDQHAAAAEAVDERQQTRLTFGFAGQRMD